MATKKKVSKKSDNKLKLLTAAKSAKSIMAKLTRERNIKVGELKLKLSEMTRERNAYKKAKEGNDERFMNERDDARAERDEAQRQGQAMAGLCKEWEQQATENSKEPVLAELAEIRKALSSFGVESGHAPALIESLKAQLKEAKEQSTIVGVLTEVQEERARQNIKWGVQNHPDGTGPSEIVIPVNSPSIGSEFADHAKKLCNEAAAEKKITWRHIFMEETAEALAESDPKALRAELIQTIAVGTQWVEAIDRRLNGRTG